MIFINIIFQKYLKFNKFFINNLKFDFYNTFFNFFEEYLIFFINI